MTRFAALLLTTLLLPACGQSGDLYRPESRSAAEAPQPRSDTDDFEEGFERQDEAGPAGESSVTHDDAPLSEDAP